MPQYTYCFLDLDGTLIDSAQGVTGCVRYALDKLGISVPPDDDLTCFIGPTLLYSFSTFFGLNEADSHRAVDYYRERYNAGGLFECRVYNGIEDVLKRLNDEGVICVLATCKPHEYATRILAHFGLERYFTLVVGPELSGLRNEKHEVIAYAMEQLHISDPTTVLMVGDRAGDVLGARKNGVSTVGVLWGFGTDEELQSAGALARLRTLGSGFIPAATHAGGLRYHGMSSTLSELYDQGILKARSVKQTDVFAAAEYFARIEGILPAPESAHAIKVAMDEAIQCRETGEKKTIVFGLTGTGYFDMMSYEKFHDGKMTDYVPTDDEIAAALSKTPKI